MKPRSAASETYRKLVSAINSALRIDKMYNITKNTYSYQEIKILECVAQHGDLPSNYDAVALNLLRQEGLIRKNYETYLRPWTITRTGQNVVYRYHAAQAPRVSSRRT